mmetsp:Transcript_9956/g.15138  ORF Transcript_9956/g.15138 Transcript_9956/m.15138 type:complete len:146 (+) Transcript_9956:56-493(+)|eukprot:CAMPEP_0202699492 /NCGR_PEP_ID=MMETSP1385-20130828/12730_1 /ASSEMBLY_ACC=CAM_ASM_000861 /TAXON_ID=933848 /ORGANISM="Elphidium margaritaceum" /LENGTH=145 /DNA_ID=CAMNT_0049356455 /DNA_START=40 /DNA_END=477 /DNA_ORIENTATION=-
MNGFVQPFDDQGVGLFAKPLITEKMMKKLLKILKAIKEERKKHTILGIKPVSKAIDRDNTKGILILAGDVKQVDMIAHLPILCEDKSIPYVWVSHRKDLCSPDTGFRPKSIPAVILLRRDALEDKYKEKFDELAKKIKEKNTMSS